jgi:hypothetical protein
MHFSEQTYFLIGIDDTDNADSRGTGFHSRQLSHQLEASGYAEVTGITRHQLFVNSAIRYTSQNSSACIGLYTDNISILIEICENYLIKNSATGSDAGLCILPGSSIGNSILDWGSKAKNTLLYMDEARSIATRSDIYLKGFTGTHEGIIGALAAVGLRASGNDGRFIWRKGKKELRELEPGIIQIENLIKELELDAVETIDGKMPSLRDNIYINEWVRPILKNQKAILIADKTENNDEYKWRNTSKEVIRTIS